jgi:O-antigen/teichoic acid export membrane protein
LTAVAIGWFTFSQNPVQVEWRSVLLVIVPLAATTVYWSPSLAILEGAGDRELIYRVRFYQMACGSFCVWAALAIGLGIWSLVVATVVQTIVSGYVVLVYRGEFFHQFSGRVDDHDFSWVRDVLPLQWRVAVNGLLFHVATQFLAVCVMTFHSAAESGRLGMTISITTAIQMLALAWVQTKYPLISAMHGDGGRETAGTLWRQTTLVSSIILCVAFAGLVASIATLSLFQRGWEDRFVELKWVTVLGVGCLANHWVALQAFYVMARGKKPFIAAPLIGYSITTACVWVGGYYYSVPGVVTGFTLGNTLAVLPMHTWSYLRLRRSG